MRIEQLNRTWDVYACACSHGFTIHEGDFGQMEDQCSRCELPWTHVAHIPRIKPIFHIQK